MARVRRNSDRAYGQGLGVFPLGLTEAELGADPVKIGSWTGTPREKRAPRVGIGSTVFGR